MLNKTIHTTNPRAVHPTHDIHRHCLSCSHNRRSCDMHPNYKAINAQLHCVSCTTEGGGVGVGWGGRTYWEFSICYAIMLKSISCCLNWPALSVLQNIYESPLNRCLQSFIFPYQLQSSTIRRSYGIGITGSLKIHKYYSLSIRGGNSSVRMERSKHYTII